MLQNLRLVRGLDYYTKTVFEWVTNELGAQGTVCRRDVGDGLIEQLAKPTLRLICNRHGRYFIAAQTQKDVVTDVADVYYRRRSAFEIALKLAANYAMHCRICV